MPPEVYPVHQVTRYLRELLESNRHLTEIWVAGEVSNLTRASSGHIYFTLKDATSALRCAFFRNRNLGQRTQLEEGMSVVVYGSLSVYEQRGELSFIVDFVQPEGTGALAAEFERRKAALEAEGLFAPERKRPLPRFPQRIGVVTSPTGAVFHDIADVLGRRWPLGTLLLQPTPVQGEGSALSIAEAIRVIARDQSPDVVIVARGGGAAEDLWAFNEEPVVRAIFGCPVPVISAVGHETDTTLADLVADLRAPTPSAAAELVAPDRFDVERAIAAFQRHAELQIIRTVADARDAIEHHAAVLSRSLPDVASIRSRLRDRAGALSRNVTLTHMRSRERTEALAARVRALSPLATLERGYALVLRADGTAATSAAELATGQHVALRMHDGTRAARIEADQPGVTP